MSRVQFKGHRPRCFMYALTHLPFVVPVTSWVQLPDSEQLKAQRTEMAHSRQLQEQENAEAFRSHKPYHSNGRSPGSLYGRHNSQVHRFLFLWKTRCLFKLNVFPQTVWPHWGVITVGVKAQCSIEVLSVVFGIFPVNFHTNWLLWHVHVHFDCTGSHATVSPEVSPGVFPVNFQTKDLLRNVRVHFDGAGSHKARHLIKKSCARRSLPRDLAKRPLVEILFSDVAKRPLPEILPTKPLQRCCTQILPGDLLWNLVQNLPRRWFTASLNRDLTLRCLTKIFCRDLCREISSRVLPRESRDLL